MSDNFYTQKGGKYYINVRVSPKASKNEIIGLRDRVLLVSVTAVPKKNQANEAVIRILSKTFRIAKSKIEVISGSKGKNKVVCIDSDIILKLGILKLGEGK